MHLKKQKKIYQSVLRCLKTFPWVLRYVQYLYILNQIDKLIMYTFESYNFLSGQTNKKSYRTLYMKGP